MTFEQGEIILYKSDDDQAVVDVRLQDKTAGLSQAQLQDLFGREGSVITKHDLAPTFPALIFKD